MVKRATICCSAASRTTFSTAARATTPHCSSQEEGGEIGAGRDLVGVTVDLVAGTARRITDKDTLVSIENIVGTDGRDIITGNDLDNELNGRFNDDSINGAGGNDIIGLGNLAGGGTTPRGGGRTLQGGAGDDTIFGDVDDELVQLRRRPRRD